MRRTAPTLATLAALGALALGGCVPANAYNDRNAFRYGDQFYGYPSYGYPSYGYQSYGNTLFGYPAYGFRRDDDYDRYDDDRDRRRPRDRDDYDRGHDDGDRHRGDRPRGFQADAVLRDRNRTNGPVPPWQLQGPPPDDEDGDPHPYSVAAPTHSHWWGPK